jgi:hypothetical protein
MKANWRLTSRHLPLTASEQLLRGMRRKDVV